MDKVKPIKNTYLKLKIFNRDVKIFLLFLAIFILFTGMPLNIYPLLWSPTHNAGSVNLFLIELAAVTLSPLFAVLMFSEDENGVFIKISKVMAGRFFALTAFIGIIFFVTTYSVLIMRLNEEIGFLMQDILGIIFVLVYALSLVFHKKTKIMHTTPYKT